MQRRLKPKAPAKSREVTKAAPRRGLGHQSGVPCSLVVHHEPARYRKYEPEVMYSFNKERGARKALERLVCGKSATQTLLKDTNW